VSTSRFQDAGAILEKSSSAFRTISEVATDLDVPKHVLRFWEGKFPQLRPMKRGGGRRYYRPEDVELLRGIRWLLYSDGYTIKGVQRILKNQGVRFVKDYWRDPPSSKTQPESELSFPIPNLAGEAASEARRSRRGAERPSSGDGKKASAPTPYAALTTEQRGLLQSLLQHLEECRALLQASVDIPSVEKLAPKRGARGPALDA